MWFVQFPGAMAPACDHIPAAFGENLYFYNEVCGSGGGGAPRGAVAHCDILSQLTCDVSSP